ncbi:Extracellular sulfatase Sulf-1 [Armadillidium nasatum]|uniref:Extracellular sulfatase Sulf-1 n=1 Tax=Armadillidium nasatum TaxID=96803 RepID=A0A5N5TNF5_9CRUS|nr:Extracellular sulfatase Sulf-1 [Armadillidium nasatum]
MLFSISNPNIVLVITDDQDSLLNSISVMQNTLALIGDKGVSFTNSFVANGPEKSTFPVLLNEAGYRTFFSGKYLNNYGYDAVGGLAHVPPGWNSWVALQGNSVYYNYYLSVNGTSVYHGDDPDQDYLTNIIKDEGVKFIEDLPEDVPFFMMLSTPSSHSPDTPEPKYENSLNSSTIPNTPNFNIANENKNWFVMQGEQPLRQEVVDEIHEIYRNRLRTLLSVDDLVESVISKLEERGFLDNTYVFFTSDHGYHLGQFSMPRDKREPYEFDIRVPLLVRGPGISEGAEISDVVTNIDLAPTFLELAGLEAPQNMDGVSFKSYLLNSANPTVNISERTLLIEHSGEGSENPTQDCEYLGTGMIYCVPDLDCKCQDAFNNTYNCVRTLGMERNEIYCIWNDYDNFEEYYDLNTDPYQITNSAGDLTDNERSTLQQKLASLIGCSGSSCQNVN